MSGCVVVSYILAKELKQITLPVVGQDDNEVWIKEPYTDRAIPLSKFLTLNKRDIDDGTLIAWLITDEQDGRYRDVVSEARAEQRKKLRHRFRDVLLAERNDVIRARARRAKKKIERENNNVNQ